MHPELLNNSLFLRYYKQWQDDPGSIVFAPIAEYFLMYDMLDSAMNVCREGVKRHPNLVSGRIVMARIHMKRGNWEEAEGELRHALSVAPANSTAREMMDEIAALRRAEREQERSVPRAAMQPEAPDSISHPSWSTVTMARILAAQGHRERAREIYQSILKGDPANEAARAGMDALSQVAQAAE